MNLDLVSEVVFYGDYFWNFHKRLDKKTKLKVDWTINLLETVTHVPEKYFKYLTNIYRFFAFFDEGKLIIAINGFQKKTNNTPKSEIEKAQRIKKQYFDEK